MKSKTKLFVQNFLFICLFVYVFIYLLNFDPLLFSWREKATVALYFVNLSSLA